MSTNFQWLSYKFIDNDLLKKYYDKGDLDLLDEKLCVYWDCMCHHVDCIWADQKHRYIIFSLERGENGKYHWQGGDQTFSSARYNSQTKLFCDGGFGRAEKPTARLGDDGKLLKQMAAVEWYCSKQDTHVAGPYVLGKYTTQGSRDEQMKESQARITECTSWREVLTKGDSFAAGHLTWAKELYNCTREVPADWEIKNPYDWQQALALELQSVPRARHILVIKSTGSGTGKTTTAKYMKWLLKDKMLLTDCMDKRDVIYMYDSHTVIWFNIAKDGYIDWKFMENLSDQGCMTSTKFITCEKFIKAHIVITTNADVKEDTIHGQRLRIIEINQGMVRVNNGKWMDCGGKKGASPN